LGHPLAVLLDVLLDGPRTVVPGVPVPLFRPPRPAARGISGGGGEVAPLHNHVHRLQLVTGSGGAAVAQLPAPGEAAQRSPAQRNDAQHQHLYLLQHCQIILFTKLLFTKFFFGPVNVTAAGVTANGIRYHQNTERYQKE